MKVFVCLLLAAVTVSSLPLLEDLESEWAKFKHEHKKTYKSLLEEERRKSIFADNYQLIVNHNVLYEQGKESYFLKVNHLADMTLEERNGILNGAKQPRRTQGDVAVYQFEPKSGVPVPDSIDWREKGAVTGVKNQGGCGSCWAFSVTGAVEAQYFLKTGKLVSLSEQNIMDCCKLTGSCNGGWMNDAFTCIFLDDGLDSEESYPYQAKDAACHYELQSNVTSLKGYSNIEAGNQEHLKAAVGTVGPVSVSIDASRSGFGLYGGGIYHDETCGNTISSVDHGVLVVGYGTENSQDYWLIKNSWGSSYGVNGYLKLSRNTNNDCGVASVPSFPVMY